jgi:cellulose synthase/poly-beta-1,6-N-acetylglucosamine synthase-like glycosyltransferase
MDPYLIPSVIPLILAAGILVELLRAERIMPRLIDIEPVTSGPRVSIVLAARDEAAAIDVAVTSMLSQYYDDLEVVAVDDRSHDGTAEILDRIARADPRLRVLHLREVPDGWLGKNHALQRGADMASGTLLLFTDADVVMEPDAVARAVALLGSGTLDHLAAAPHARVPGTLASGFVALFTLFFALYARPWRARDPRSRAHVGIGAFNPVRSEAYHAVNGHRPIALRPDDDMRLGRLLKTGRFRQDFVLATESLRVDWYGSLAGMVRGLEKNAFAAVDYRLTLVAGATAAQLLLFVWPFAGLFVNRGPALVSSAITVAILCGLHAGAARRQGVTPTVGLLFPAYVLLFLFVLWRSALLTLWRGGILWRGTFYPLDRLRSGR